MSAPVIVAQGPGAQNTGLLLLGDTTPQRPSAQRNATRPPSTNDNQVGLCLQTVWPIIDDTYTIAELIAEATPQLPQLAAQAHAVIAGDIAWRTANATDIPGWTAYPGLVLIAEAQAVPTGRPHSNRDARIATIRSLAGAEYTDAQIAAMLGLSRSNVAEIRRRNDIPSAHRPADAARRRRHTHPPLSGHRERDGSTFDGAR